MTSYCCGFLFAPILPGPSRSAPRVLLIRKSRPRWQWGLLNGVGGHIEPGETPHEAMVREFKEEAGLDIPSWSYVAVLTGGNFRVHFFSAHTSFAQFEKATAMTDEPLVGVPVNDLAYHRVILNLRVLIPLALDESGILKPVDLVDASLNPA